MGQLRDGGESVNGTLYYIYSFLWVYSYFKIKSFLKAKKITNMKRQATMRIKYFQNIFDKELVSRTHK